MRTLAPGLYQIVPVTEISEEEDDVGEPIVLGTGFYVDADAAYNRYEDGGAVLIVGDFDPGVGIVDSPVGPAGTLILTLGIDDAFPMDSVRCTSVNSPLGPLTISDRYAIMPTTDRTLCEAPAGQDAVNWIVLDLAVETTVSVDDGRILIGDDVVDVGAGPDFRISTHSLDGVDVKWSIDTDDRSRIITTKHVIRAGTDLHSLLMGMINGEDDGVLAFINTDADGLAAVKAIDTPEARLIEAELSTHLDEGFIGTVLGFYVKGAILPLSTIEGLPEHQRADLVNA